MAGLPALAQPEVQPLPDLVPTIYALDLENGVLQLEGAVRNQGTAAYLGGDDVVVQSSDGVKRYLKLPEIPEGAEYRFSLTIRGAGASVDVVVHADPRDKVAELFEGNNRAEKRTSRPADLLIAGLRVESDPTEREPAHLLAEVRDRFRSVAGVEPTPIQVRVRASLRPAGGQPIDFLLEDVTVPDFTGIHLMPVDVGLPSDARARAGGARSADVEVEVCVNLDGHVAELGEQCEGAAGCNNCSVLVLDDVVLPEPPLTEAERRERARAEEEERTRAEAEARRVLDETRKADEAARLAQAETERIAAEEAARQADEAARREAEARAQAEVEAARLAEEAARLAEDEARRAEVEAERARLQAEARAEEEARQRAEAAARAKAEAAAKARAEAEARARIEAEARARAEAAKAQAARAQAPSSQPEATDADTGDALAEAAGEPPFQAAPLAPDLVISSVRVAEGTLTRDLRLEVEVRDLHQATRAGNGPLAVELRHAPWRLEDTLRATLDRTALAETGTAKVVLEGPLRATPGLCGPNAGERALETVTLSVASVAGELDVSNNARTLRLDLACHTDREARGLGPMPDPALAAVQPYVVDVGGKQYLQFMAHVHNLGTPIRADGLDLKVVTGSRSWLPESWQQASDHHLPMASAVVDDPLNALPPRKVTICGLGGTLYPLADLPSFARAAGTSRPVGTDNSVEVTVTVGTSPTVRQLSEDNDSLVVAVPLDRDLRPVDDTACGVRPAAHGVQPDRVRWATERGDATLATTTSLAARISAERTASGTTFLRGEITQGAPGRVPRVEYAWRRDGVWAGGGTVDVPANAPAVVHATDGGDSTATWELVVDPGGLLEDGERSNDVARLTLPPKG